MFFKVGDIVTIRKDFKERAYPYLYKMADGTHPLESRLEMRAKAGKQVKIVNISYGHYEIDADGYFWTDEMFEEYLHRPEIGDLRFKMGVLLDALSSNTVPPDYEETLLEIKTYFDRQKMK